MKFSCLLAVVAFVSLFSVECAHASTQADVQQNIDRIASLNDAAIKRAEEGSHFEAAKCYEAAASLYTNLEMNDKAVDASMKAVDSYMEARATYTKHGSDFEAAKCYQEAAFLYEILEMNDKAVDTYMEAGAAYTKHGSHFEAAKCYEAAASLYKTLEMNGKAVDASMKAVDAYMEARAAHTKHGSHFEAAKCYEAAASLYKTLEMNDKAVDASMKAVDAYMEAGAAHTKHGSHFEAAKRYEKAASLCSSEQPTQCITAMWLAASALAVQGKYIDADKIVDRAVQMYRSQKGLDRIPFIEAYVLPESLKMEFDAGALFDTTADIYNEQGKIKAALDMRVRAAEAYAAGKRHARAATAHEAAGKMQQDMDEEAVEEQYAKAEHHYLEAGNSEDAARMRQVIRVIRAPKQYIKARKAFSDRRNHLEEEIVMAISHENPLQSSYTELMKKPAQEWENSIVKIEFAGQVGADTGGLTREWLTLFFKEIERHELIVPGGDGRTYRLNQAKRDESSLKGYEAIGRALALALLMDAQLPFHLQTGLLRGMLLQPVEFEDLKQHDPQYYNNLKATLEISNQDLFEMKLNFVRIIQGEERELCGNGRDRQVDKSNVAEYVRLAAEMELYGLFKPQQDGFFKGFHEVVYRPALEGISVNALDLLLSSHSKIDVKDWREHTKYGGGYTENSNTIEMFWTMVENMTPEDLAGLLMFATGSDRLPLEGFKSLNSPFTIVRIELNSEFGVPTAQTCFNRIYLPEYQTREHLEKGVFLALAHGVGFGLA